MGTLPLDEVLQGPLQSLRDHSLQLQSDTRFRYANRYVYQVYVDIEE